MIVYHRISYGLLHVQKHGRSLRYKCTAKFNVLTAVCMTTCVSWNCTSSLLATVKDISKALALFLKLANIYQWPQHYVLERLRLYGRGRP